jgi:hypothetical protein
MVFLDAAGGHFFNLPRVTGGHFFNLLGATGGLPTSAFMTAQ